MKKLTILALAAALLWPGGLLAHGGGLDSSGCHTQNGVRHCHRDKDGDVDWCTVLTVAGALGAAWLIYEWVRDDDMSLAPGLRVAPYLTDQDEAGLMAEYVLGNGQRLGLRTEHRVDGPRDETRLSLRWTVGF